MSNLNIQRIQIGDLKNPFDVQRLSRHLQELYNATIPVVTGSGAPTSIPPKISAQYIDTLNNHVYIATGISKTSQWVKVS